MRRERTFKRCGRGRCSTATSVSSITCHSEHCLELVCCPPPLWLTIGGGGYSHRCPSHRRRRRALNIHTMRRRQHTTTAAALPLTSPLGERAFNLTSSLSESVSVHPAAHLQQVRFRCHQAVSSRYPPPPPGGWGHVCMCDPHRLSLHNSRRRRNGGRGGVTSSSPLPFRRRSGG